MLLILIVINLQMFSIKSFLVYFKKKQPKITLKASGRRVGVSERPGHRSYTTLQAVMKDILGITVSTGFPAGRVKQAGESLKKPCEEPAGQLPEAGQV
jgi:hypothetical protein